MTSTIIASLLSGFLLGVLFACWVLADVERKRQAQKHDIGDDVARIADALEKYVHIASIVRFDVPSFKDLNNG